MGCGQCGNRAASGNLDKIRAAMEAAGVTGLAADSIITGASSDHGMHGAESSGIAESRARGYLKELTDAGITLDMGAASSIHGELTRYFMTA